MHDPVTRERLAIPTPRGKLAGELAYPAGRLGFAAILFNPHPHMGGSMDNNLVARLAQGLAGRGGLTLRFDYGGVGESTGAPIDVAASMASFWETGVAPEDPMMVDDAKSASRFFRDLSLTTLPQFVVGYSFGSYVASHLIDDSVAGVALISPTIVKHDLSRFLEFPLPALVVHSDNDFATPLEVTERWCRALPDLASRHVLAGGEHFFRGQEDAVLSAVAEFVSSNLVGSDVVEEAVC